MAVTARASYDDCQDERPRDRNFLDGITLELAAIEAIAGPFIVALATARAAHAAGDKTALKVACEQMSDASEGFGTLRAHATFIAHKLGHDLRRTPRVRF
jgi:hypothetical protein